MAQSALEGIPAGESPYREPKSRCFRFRLSAAGRHSDIERLLLRIADSRDPPRPPKNSIPDTPSWSLMDIYRSTRIFELCSHSVVTPR